MDSSQIDRDRTEYQQKRKSEVQNSEKQHKRISLPDERQERRPGRRRFEQGDMEDSAIRREEATSDEGRAANL